jgi:DNA-binding transcriptional LysR family regulator
MFAERGLVPPRLRVESGSVMIIRGLLLEGDWLTLMARDQFVVERNAGLLRELGVAGTILRRQIGYTVRADWHPTRTQMLFVTALQEASAARDDVDAWPFLYG